MKNSKKLISVLIISILGSALFLTGCGEKPATADVTVKAFYNLYILGDSTDIEKIALTKEEVNTVLDQLKSASESATKNEITKSGLQITNDQLDAIYNAQMEAFKKLTVTTEMVSEDKDKATVKLTTTYLDITALDNKAAKEAGNEVNAMALTSQSEWNNKAVELYVNKLIEGFKVAQSSTETKEATFECEKKTYAVDGKNKDIYTPVDMEKFGTDIGKLVSGI